MIINIVSGSLYIWSSINLYYVSYLKLHDSPNMEINDGYFMMPLINYLSASLQFLGATLENKFGLKFCIFIGTIISIISNLILYYSTSQFIIYLAMIGIGTSVAILVIPSIKNALLYFPNKKGLINGLTLLGYGCSSFIYNTIAQKYINPNYVLVDQKTKLFPKNIAENVKFFIYVINYISAIAYFIAFLLSYPYNKKNEKEKKKELVEKEEIVVDPVKQAFKDKTVYQIMIMTFIMRFFGVLTTNTYRTFGQLNNVSEKLLANLSIVYGIVNGVIRLFWGILFDKFGFKKLYFICVSSQIIILFTIFGSVNIPYLFFIIVIFEAIVSSGNTCLMVSVYPKIYDIKYYSMIYSLTNIFVGLSTLLGPVFIKLLIKKVDDYMYLYMTGGIIVGIDFIILCFFNEDKFIFKKDGRKEEEELVESKN